MDLTVMRAMMSKILTALFVMIMGVAMILPSNLAIASPADGDGSGDGGTDQKQGEQEEPTEPREVPEEPEVPTEPPIDEALPPPPEEVREYCDKYVDDPECQPKQLTPCVLNPDLPECQPPPPPPCDPTKQQCPPPPPPCDPTKQQCPKPICDPKKQQCIICGRGTHLENGKCVPNKNNGGSSRSSSSSSSSSATATATATATAAEVSSCRLDGSTHGIQQKFDTAKYQACGLYPNGQKAYTDGFVVGCTQVGNTQLICQALVDSSILNMRTQPTQTPTQPPQTPQTQTTTQPTQGIQPTQ
jgi:hypothetical protein